MDLKAGIVTKPVFSAGFILDFFRSLGNSKNKMVPNVVLFLFYLGAASLSLYFNRQIDIAPALIWAPAGIALAGLIIAGYAVVPGLFFAALVTGLLNGYTVPVLIGATLGNTLQAILGAYLLKKFKFSPIFTSVRDMYALLIVVVLASLALPSIVLSITWLAGALQDNFSNMWARVWVGNMLSILILTPLITTWILKPRLESKPFEIIERGLAFMLLGTILYVLFWLGTPQIVGIPIAYFLLIPLFWIGLRFTPRWMTFALFSMTVAGLGGVGWLAQQGVIPLSAVGERLFGIEMFMLVIGAMFLVFATVVQERRHASKALQIHVARLQQAVSRIQREDDAKSEFLAILAHELRNPLALVLSTLEFLKLRIPADIEEGSMLRGAEERVHSMSHMLNDLLDMSRISQRTFELDTQPIELSQALRGALQSVALIMQNRDHQFNINLPTKPVWVMIDPVRFEQIIVNLLTNAAKYTPPGGLIELDGKIEEEALLLRVRDNGIGIPSHLIDRIFEPFQQVSEKRLRTTGLGIGLSITKRLVEMHGGTIEAQSRGAGQGSEFIVRIPTVPAQTASTPPANTQQARQTSEQGVGSLDILIIDDNEAAAHGMGKLLEHKGHTVRFGYTGKEAIKTIVEQTPEVAILDIGLPDIDGYEIAQYIRRETDVDTVLVALTGYGQEQDKQKAREAGFDFHLTKPVGIADIEQILAVIKRT